MLIDYNSESITVKPVGDFEMQQLFAGLRLPKKSEQYWLTLRKLIILFEQGKRNDTPGLFPVKPVPKNSLERRLQLLYCQKEADRNNPALINLKDIPLSYRDLIAEIFREVYIRNNASKEQPDIALLTKNRSLYRGRPITAFFPSKQRSETWQNYSIPASLL
jgi:hypothetical protein